MPRMKTYYYYPLGRHFVYNFIINHRTSLFYIIYIFSYIYIIYLYFHRKRHKKAFSNEA